MTEPKTGKRKPDKAADSALGRKGEAIAAKYYQQRGYLLLNHNYRTRLGEIDLILYKEGTLVFAEVKTRSKQDAGFGTPAEAVTPRKQRSIILAADNYLQNSPYADDTIRYDVVEVLPAEKGWKVHCIENAFEC